jgi:predicted Zn finger-like uncharacterized protein
MYTQCPECKLTFRVSADVLRKAAGKVRCGGCGATFNALLYLSENRPDEQPAPVPPTAPPELEAEPMADPDALPPPTAVSPEQSQRLRESLNQIDESDVRIEDTGIEWRILSEDRDGDIDELLDADETPIDEDLSADSADTRIDASEVFAGATHEMRFDDNTGLPDDFDYDTPARSPAPKPEPEPEPEPIKSHSDKHVDIAFGDAEEWGELLDELAGELETAQVDEPTSAEDETSEEIALDEDPVEESAGDESAGEDFDTALAEMHALLDGARPNAAAEIEKLLEETERDLHDSTIEEDLLDAAFESERSRMEAAHARNAENPEDEKAEPSANQDDAPGTPLGDELEMALDLGDSIALDLDALSEEDENIALAFKAANEDSGDNALEDEQEEVEVSGDPEAGETSRELEDLEAPDEPEDVEVSDEIEDREASDDLERREESDELQDRESSDELEELDEPMELIPEAPTTHDVPEQSEEEQTINRMIDEELLAVAYVDETGQTSMIGIDEGADEAAAAEAPERGAEDRPDSEGETDEQAEDAAAFYIPEELANVDASETITIIMEGESFVDGSEPELRDTSARQAAEKTDAELAELREALQKQAEAEAKSGSNRFDARRLRAAIVLLAVLLVAQGLHFSRTALATMPGIGNVIKPVYSAIGMPITPGWDITGWQIEVSKASAGPVAASDGELEAITIVSRVRNRSDRALPHPLVSVSLVDRYMEPIGNKVLEPAEYLPEDGQAQSLVAPGQTFNAIVTIESSDPDVYNFQMSLCYREADSRLRCAIGAFK